MIGGAARGAGIQELREHLRALLELVAKHNMPVAIVQRGELVAVMLHPEEVDECRKAEYALATLHGLEIYPESVRNTIELAGLIREPYTLPPDALAAIAERPHEILGPLRTVGVSEFRGRLASYVAEIAAGRPYTLAHGGRLLVTLVSGREYERLEELRRIMRWFAAAGLDLTTSDPVKITAFVQAFRAGSARHVGRAELEATRRALEADRPASADDSIA